MKAEFVLTLFDDEETLKKMETLSRLETMFDDGRNRLPPEYYWFADEVPLGSRVKVTLEVLSSGE